MSQTSALLRELEEIEEESSQKISSAKTSVNILPRTFKAIDFEPGTVNLDYGGGRFDKVTEFLAAKDVVNYVYDPYNRSAEHNAEVLGAVRKNGGADTITCNNVLNVICEPSSRDRVIRNIKKLLKPGGTAYFLTYKGDGSGAGKETKAGYQNNRPTKFYVDEVEKHFSNVRIYKDVIIAQ